ncbi:alpha/beta fold hydrolase [Jannaschia donghaensis]|uniref:3-oxoadipate enol-lactonase n=1 Tax=Jannaschia donghaensis TaxID=420998 RepID=A0A0M6YGK8_9RHOB|nr:alpha/beta hydrolase [Jannaschia donghaensis]CTQ49488.1 3-oxoadipate enol-lactonase [Jannaschia donghaensis]
MAIEPLTARPWVLLPGTLCTGQVFDGMLDRLGVPSDRRRTLALRQPTVAAYASTLRDVSEDAVICGFSLGAIVAAHHANRLRCARLILFAVTPHPDDPANAGGRRAFAARVGSVGGAAAIAASLASLKGPDPAAARALILDMADMAAGDIVAQTDLAIGRPGATMALAASRVPIWVLTGARDEQTPSEIGRAVADAAACGSFRALDGLGHYALLEDPQACADALLDLERTTP